jgi:alpha-mannosidase
MREGEALLASAERWAAIAWWRYGWHYPSAELHAAWKRLMLNSFHDVLCGSLAEEAVPGVDDMFGYAHDVARRIVVKSQHALIPRVETTPETIPLYVFNPHAALIRAPVGLHFLSQYYPPAQRRPFALFDDQGREVVRQTNGGTAILEAGTWQPYLRFIAEVPPLASRRYEIRFKEAAAKPANPIAVTEDTDGITVETRQWSIRFSRALAAPIELIERERGRSLLRAPIQMFAMDDVSHAWGGENRVVYNQPVAPLTALAPAEVGDFTGYEGQEAPPLRIISQGSVSVTVECLVRWQHTRASIRYTLYADLSYIDIDTRLYMQARRKMIKLQFPFDVPNAQAVVEVPFGETERPTDATEYPYARWIRLDGGDLSVGVANNGQNGFDVSEDGVLNLSLSRGAVHCSWEGDPGSQALDPNRSYTWMDQGQIDTRFRLLAGNGIHEALYTAALELNQPLERFFAYHTPSTPEAKAQTTPFLTIQPATVTLAALKKAEDDDALIVRLLETAGQMMTARITLDQGKEQSFDFRAHQIRTFRVTRDGLWSPCNLIEE